MSPPAKRALFALIVVILLAASSAIFAVILAKLTRQQAQAFAEDAESRDMGAEQP